MGIGFSLFLFVVGAILTFAVDVNSSSGFSIDTVTETEAGQRHELRVEREPISDQEVQAVPADPNRSDASTQPESPTSDSNDWFRPEGDPPR